MVEVATIGREGIVGISAVINGGGGDSCECYRTATALLAGVTNAAIA